MKSNKNPQTLSAKEYAALGLLVARGEMFGLEMVEASGGELKRGTIYVTLQKLAEKGFLESREEERVAPEIGIPRRKFKATGLGERIYKAQTAALREFNLILSGV